MTEPASRSACVTVCEAVHVTDAPGASAAVGGQVDRHLVVRDRDRPEQRHVAGVRHHVRVGDHLADVVVRRRGRRLHERQRRRLHDRDRPGCRSRAAPGSTSPPVFASRPLFVTGEPRVQVRLRERCDAVHVIDAPGASARRRARSGVRVVVVGQREPGHRHVARVRDDDTSMHGLRRGQIRRRRRLHHRRARRRAPHPPSPFRRRRDGAVDRRRDIRRSGRRPDRPASPCTTPYT